MSCSSPETPHVATLTKVLWARRMEVMADLEVSGLGGWVAYWWRTVTVNISAGVPFRRRNYGLSGVSPITVRPSVYFCVE